MSAYNEVAKAWKALQRRKCPESGNSGGAHYKLVYALMQAGKDCRGLTNPEIEGLAITYLINNMEER